MKTFLRRISSAAVLVATLFAAASAVATPTISFVTPTSGSTIPLSTTPTGVTVTVNAAPTAGAAINTVQFFDNGVSIGSASGSSPFSITWFPTTAGAHTLTATVTDTTSSNNSATVTSFVTVTTARSVTLTTSAGNTSPAQNSTIILRVSAVMSDAIVGSVEFFLDGSLTPLPTTRLGTVTFNASVDLTAANGFTTGAHTIVAKATSSDNSVTVDSAPVSLTIAAPIAGNAPPTVSITGPANNASVSLSTNTTISASATDSDGFIPSTSGGGVTFYADGDPITPVGTGEANPDLVAPYTITWRPTVARTYSLRAQTIDNSANIVLSAPITVTAVTAVPTVTLTSVSSTVVGSNVSLSATATPGSGATVTAVEFLVDGAVIATDTSSPYSATYNAAEIGTYTLTARVTDSNGTQVTSTPRTLSVTAVPPPTVAVTVAATGTINTAMTVNATAIAGGNNTISNVQFFANGASIGTDTSAPYSVSWTPTSAGTYSITATATDSAGQSTTSTASTVTVGAPSNLAVSISLTGSVNIPAGSTRIVTATPTPASGVDHIELLYDERVVASDSTAPFTFLFTAPDSLGLHALSARVVDTSGVSATSSNLLITTVAPTGNPPLISVTTPTANSFLGPNVATVISGTASDSDGNVNTVQVFVNGSSIGNANLNGTNWTINWTPNTAGIYTIVAVASDNSGNAIAAPALSVTVGDSSTPAITLALSPVLSGQAATTTLPVGATRNIVANASAASGRAIVRVEFFVDGTKVGEDTTAPYTYRYAAPALAEGELSHTYIFSARATDNAGAARDVLQPLVVVSKIGESPVVNLLTPANGAAVAPGASVSLAATAVANGGTISSVQFYVNGSPAGINGGNAIVNAPYTTTFVPSAPGTYTIDAIATDDRGNTSVSNSATITAAFATPTVNITSPNPNATARATPNVPLNLAATAVVQSGAGAAVLLVEFLLDGVQIGADTTAPYTFAWTPTAAQLGEHVLTARVTDTNGQTATSSPVNVNVANVVGTPPTISIVQPTGGTGAGQAGNLQSLSTVNFVANASSAAQGVTIRSVEFFLNDVSIGTATREQSTNLYRLAYDLSRFDFSSAPSTIDQNTGAVRYTPVPLYAIARDSNNNQTVTNPLNLTINTSTSLPPSVQILATSQTTITQGQSMIILPNFSDPDGTVTLLQVYANGVASGGAISNPQPNTTFPSFTSNVAGRYNVYLVATDDTGNTAVSSPAIVVTVNAIAAPVTTITRPSNDSTVATVNSPVFLEGTASSADPTQTPTLTFIATSAGGARTTINGQRVGTTTTYRAIWTPSTPGTYTVTTQANIGTTAQSTSTESRRVVVTNLQGLGPSVTISVPSSATTASTANFTATATDPDGSVVEVEFFLNRNSIGLAKKDDQANTWRLTASFASILPGSVEVVALARDSAGNVAASTTNTITVTAAPSIAPNITITPSTTNAAFNRQVQLRATASDTDGTVNSVQYFSNGSSLGTSTNASTSYQVNWTPNQSGKFNLWAVATDNSGVTTVSPTIEITVRRNNPIQEDAAFILQTYQDIANTTTINPLVFDDLDARLSAGTLSRSDLVVSLMTESGFTAPVNLLAAYYVIMGQWPTPANYTSLLATARGSLSNAVGSILSSNEYTAKYGPTPTTTLLNNPASTIPAQTFLNRLYQNAGLGAPSPLQLVQFMNNPTASATLGRGYNPATLNTAVAEFVTLTNSTNTALFNQARAAALFYQLNRPPITVTVDQITQRVAALAQLADAKAIADSLLKDSLYTYRYVTFVKNPVSLVVNPRAGAIFSVEALGAPPLSYQWLLNGAPISGATDSFLSLTNVNGTRVGTYTVVVTSATGISATSDPATLTTSTAVTRLANISTRGQTTGAGDNVLIGGFVVAGTGAQQSRQMLIRVVGPRLSSAPFNVAGALADPRLEVYAGSNPTPVLTNDNWGTQTGGAAQVTAIQQATNRAGAFALQNNSADAAVLATLPPGPYTVQAKSPGGNTTGVVLIEVYDVTPGANAAGKATNVSTRGNVGTGANVLIAGFVVNGSVSRRVLIRGVGPTLTRFGLPGSAVLSDPQLTLIDQSTGETIETNNDWATRADAAIIASAANASGAFALQNGSKDAAMIVMLPPGQYTVQLSGVNNATGVGIVEVYDVDP